jgi:signal transduction histidine kinase
MLNTNHPAVALVLLVGLTIIALVPLVSWVTLGNGRDKKAKLWFLGMLFYVINVALFAFQFTLPAWLAFGVANTGSLLMMVFMTESLRQEISNERAQWEWISIFVGAWFCVYLILIHKGYRGSWGILFMGITMVMTQIKIIFLLLKVKAIYKSRSCLILILAFALSIFTNLIRGASGLFENMFIDLLEFSAISNFFFISILISSILVNFGYWGLVLEKVQISKNQEAENARKQQLSSLAFKEYSEELQELVKQRNQMLMLVSKFSAASSLAVFNTAIIHELSQPIQSLSLCLEGLALNIQQANWDEASKQTDNAKQLTQKMGATLHSLRSLIQTQKTDLEILEMSKILGQLMPIMQAECKRNGIELTFSKPNEEVYIKANKVLLERIVMNLVANSMEAFKSMESPLSEKFIHVKSALVQEGVKPTWQLIVEDNATGFTEDILKTITDPFVTTKLTGLGVGLSFANLILRLWEGQMDTSNRSTEEGGGALVSIRIPQA